MKAVSVSSAAISNAMRYSQTRMQIDLVKAQKEMDSGRVADTGLALGARSAQVVNFHRDLDRLNALVDSNALVSARLKSTQDSLGQIVSVTQDLVNALTVAVAGDSPDSVTAKSGSTMLQSLTTILNSSMNGEYLFAGTNTDVRPVEDYLDPASPAKAAFDAAFHARFGFTKDDPAAADISAADIESFITDLVEPQFLGAGWEANWSNATDQTIVSRIALNETTPASVSANNEGLRKAAMAAVLAYEAFSGNLGEEAKSAVARRAQALAGEAIADLGQLQSQTGIIQNRVSEASTRINTQIDLFERHIIDLEGVDPYEAANRVNDLMAHIQTSFALTARIQQLSLLNYLT